MLLLLLLLLLFSHSVMSDYLQTHGLQSSGSSVHEVLLARIRKWVAISFSKICSQTRDRTHVSCTDELILYH